jgi:hypothetical protein
MYQTAYWLYPKMQKLLKKNKRMQLYGGSSFIMVNSVGLNGLLIIIWFKQFFTVLSFYVRTKNSFSYISSFLQKKINKELKVSDFTPSKENNS